MPHYTDLSTYFIWKSIRLQTLPLICIRYKVIDLFFNFVVTMIGLLYKRHLISIISSVCGNRFLPVMKNVQLVCKYLKITNRRILEKRICSFVVRIIYINIHKYVHLIVTEKSKHV